MANDAFTALAHPIRREIVERRSGGAATIGEASRGLGVSKPTITRHVRLLEEAGVVTRVVDGRNHRLGLRPETLADAAEWMESQQTRWDRPVRRGRRLSRGAGMTEQRARALRIERTFDAPAERVFGA